MPFRAAVLLPPGLGCWLGEHTPDAGLRPIPRVAPLFQLGFGFRFQLGFRLAMAKANASPTANANATAKGAWGQARVRSHASRSAMEAIFE